MVPSSLLSAGAPGARHARRSLRLGSARARQTLQEGSEAHVGAEQCFDQLMPAQIVREVARGHAAESRQPQPQTQDISVQVMSVVQWVGGWIVFEARCHVVEMTNAAGGTAVPAHRAV